MQLHGFYDGRLSCKLKRLRGRKKRFHDEVFRWASLLLRCTSAQGRKWPRMDSAYFLCHAGSLPGCLGYWAGWGNQVAANDKHGHIQLPIDRSFLSTMSAGLIYLLLHKLRYAISYAEAHIGEIVDDMMPSRYLRNSTVCITPGTSCWIAWWRRTEKCPRSPSHCMKVGRTVKSWGYRDWTGRWFMLLEAVLLSCCQNQPASASNTL